MKKRSPLSVRPFVVWGSVGGGEPSRLTAYRLLTEARMFCVAVLAASDGAWDTVWITGRDGAVMATFSAEAVGPVPVSVAVESASQ